MEEFIKSLFYWVSASGVGLVVGWFITYRLTLERDKKQHERTLEREERERSFQTKREVYRDLVIALYDFPIKYSRVSSAWAKAVKEGGSGKEEVWQVTNCLNDLQKVLSATKLYVGKDSDISRRIEELDSKIAQYTSETDRASVALTKTTKDNPVVDKILSDFDEQVAVVFESRNHLLEELQKDLGVK